VPTKKIDLSVIILSYNTEKFIKACLGSVIKAAQRLAKPVEIIFVDNASTDDSVKVIKEEKTKYRTEKIKIEIILSNKNLGYSGGNNLGLKQAKGKYVLFLNMDTIVFPNAFKGAVEFMESNKKVGALSAKTLLISGGMDPDCHRGFPTPWASISYFLGLEKLFPKSKVFGQYHQSYLGFDKNHEIDAGFGTFMIARKEVLDQVGPWDESYFFYGEDLDYFYRIKKAGYKIWFYAKPLLRHFKGGSSGLRKESRKLSSASRETRIKTAQASVKAMEIFYHKFYKDKYPAWVTFLVLMGIKIKGFFRILYHRFS